MPEEGKSGGGGSSSVFDGLVENNTKQRPSLYYNMGVYVILYNRIKNDLMNNNPYGDPTAFDTQINNKIRAGLSGSPAEVRAFLSQYKLDNIIKIYDGPVTDEQKKEYYYEISANNLSKNLDRVMTLAKNFARVKYGKDKRMLTNDDVREILSIKEKKSELTQFEAARALTSFAGIDSEGKIKGGKLTKEWLHASRKLKGMKQNLNRGRLKALGWTALVAGGAALTGVFAFATMGLGSVAAGGVIGALYTTSQGAGALGGIIATGLSGWGTWAGLKGMMSRLGQNWKDRKKIYFYKHSKGKYAEAKEDDYENMGYGRIKERYFAYTGIKHFFDSKKLQPDAEKFKNADGSYEPDAYIPKQYRKAFHNYIAEQEELVGHGMRDLKNMRNNILHHNLVSKQDVKMDGSEFGFYGLMNYMNRGVEGYETSDLTADEVVMNYGKDEPQNRLHPDRVKEHKGYDSSLQYLMGNLKEVQKYEQKFVDAGMQNEYGKLMTLFSDNFVGAFSESLFENAYTAKMIGNASHMMESEAFKAMINSTDSQETQEHMMSVVAFLNAEKENNYRSTKILSDKVGVGVEHQLDMSRDSIIAGCASLEDTSAEAEAIADAIASMTTCSIKVDSGIVARDREGGVIREADPALIAEIDALPNEKTKKYLKHMLEVKMAACSVDGSDYVNSLSTANKVVATPLMSSIMSLSSSEDAQAIRNNISNSSLPEEVKTNLNAILDAQINGLETAIRDEARVDAIRGIKKGSSKFNELVKAIDEIKSFKKEELHDLWIKIEKVEDPTLLEYLKLRFKDKVTHELMEYATNTAKFGGENIEAQLKTIKDFLLESKALCPDKGDKFIDEWQLQKCIAALGSQVGTTLAAYLDNLEKTFLTDTTNKKDELTRLITQPIPVGLKQYFDTKTPESEAILERARRFTLSADVYSFMTVSSIGGYAGLVDADSADSKAALNIYFRQERNDSDPLLGLLKRLNQDVNGTEINSQNPDIISALPQFDSANPFTPVVINGQTIMYPNFAAAVGGSYNCQRIIKDSSGSYSLPVSSARMTDSFLFSTLKTLQTPDFVNADPAERLATLVILKKKLTGMMRVQMIRLYEKKRGSATTYPDFVHNNRTDLDNNLVTNWKMVAEIIDELISNAKSNLSLEDKELYSGVTANTVNAVNAICSLDDYQRKVTETSVFGA